MVSYFAQWFFGVQGRESHILENFAPPETQNQMNRVVCSLSSTRLVQPKEVGPCALASACGPCAGRFVQRAGHK